MWRFHNPVAVRFGRRCREGLGPDLADRRCLIVSSARGRRRFESDPILSAAVPGGRAVWADSVEPNPDVEDLQALCDGLRHTPFDAIVAFGGGSALDTAKTLAVMLADGAPSERLRELIDAGPVPDTVRPAPLYAVPTTSGTGSEVTATATVWDHHARKKRSLAGASLYPAVAVVDPDLTDELPPGPTADSGLDAVNQAAESVWNQRASPITEGLATRALQLGMPALERLASDPSDARAREDMAQCGLLAGLAISQTRTALCHSMSYPITAHFGVPHGLACAFTMPAVLAHNLRGDDGRLQRLARSLLGDGRGGSDLFAELERFNGALGVRRRVRDLVGDWDGLVALAGEMVTPGRADNTLVEADDEALRRILAAAWQG